MAIKMNIIKLTTYFFAFIFCFFVLPNNAQASNSSTFTMSISLKASSSVASKAIIAKAEEFRLVTDASGHPACQFASSSSWQSAVVSSEAIKVGVWARITCTYNKKYLKIFVNGKETGSQTLSEDIDDTSAPLKIGVDDSSGSSYGNLAGLIDDFKFYPYALNEEEIKKDYNSGRSTVMGSGGTASDGTTKTNAKNRDYCVPGDTATCDPPVLELKMDEKSGSTVYDTSGNGNNGTITGASWGRGKYGGALDFDHDDDYVAFVNNNLGLTDKITVEVWAKPRNIQYETYVHIFSRHPAWYISREIGNWRFGVGTTTSGGVSVNFDTLSNTKDKWNHFVGVYDGSTVSTYLNGIFKNSDSLSGDMSSLGEMQVGQYWGSNGSANDSFNGQIDQIRIYNYARTPAQIAYDYNRGKPIAHWKFNECSGSVIHDESGNGNNGVLNLGSSGVTADGTCASSSNSFWSWANGGKRYHAGMFDGEDNYISMGDIGMDINALSFWWTGNVASSSIVDLDNGTHTITIDDNIVSANSFSSPTIYIDGFSNSILANNNWHHILIKTDTAIDVNNLNIGKINSQYLNGFIDDFKLYNYALTATQIKSDYTNGSISFGDTSGWTCGSSKLTDIDGNSYETVLVGDQCWMAENLMVSKNADGSAVDGTGDTDTTPPSAYGDADWEATEGYLYNWQDAMNGSTAQGAQGICPTDWHLPTHDEWTDLERYICETEGNGSCDTTFPKDTTTIGWLGTNEGTELKNVTNVNGQTGTDPNGDDGYDFAGLLAGGHFTDGSFGNRGAYGGFWSSSEDGSYAWYRNLFSSNAGVSRLNADKGFGLSVRCLKD